MWLIKIDTKEKVKKLRNKIKSLYKKSIGKNNTNKSEKID